MLDPLNLVNIFNFFLVLSRIGAVIMTLPILSDDKINNYAKLFLAMAISLLILPFIKSELPAYPNSAGLLVYYIAAEVLIGIVLGFTVKIYYSSLYILGNIISMQSGLSAASLFDPSQREQIMLFSSFLTAMAVISIIGSDTHHSFLKGAIESYNYFKPGEFVIMGDLANQMSQTVANTFTLAFKISSPFLIIGMAILIGSGVLSKLMPTLQVLFVITPAQILVMFAVLYVVGNKILQIVIDNLQAAL